MANNSKGRHQEGAWQQKSGSWYFSFRDNSGRLKQRRVGPSRGPDKLSLQERYDRRQALLDGEFPTVTEKAEQQQAETKAVLTVKMAGDSWLHWARTRRRNPIRQNTVIGYVNNLNKWIYPVVGEMLLSDLKSMQAKKVIDAMVAAGSSSSVIDDVVMMMQQIIEHPKDGDGQSICTWKLYRDVMDVPKVTSTETKAFTALQIEQIIDHAQGQYKALFALLATTGLRIGESLGIEIDADPETTTTLSKDCRVLHVHTQILQTGERQDVPKTNAGHRQVDIHAGIAARLTELIGLRTSGYLFCTESGNPILYSNLTKNVLHPILWDRERPVMKRVGKGWKKVGVEKIPGVIGNKADFQKKAGAKTGYGEHSFRRFRETHLKLFGVPQPIIDFWSGHGKKTISDVYTKVKMETTKRREWVEKAGLGFELAATKVTAIKTAGKTATKGKAA